MTTAAAAAPAAPPDLVYIVRPGDNEELRYSLRSAVNIPHRKVWIVGSCPEWVRGAERITLPPKREKWANIHASLTAACTDERITDQIIVMNDDFFALEPVAEVPMFHLGRLDEYVEKGRGKHRDNSWWDAVCDTWEYMKSLGYRDALCYEGHMPMPFRRQRLGELLAGSVGRFLWGCAYSATDGPVGVLGVNAKVAARDPLSFRRRLDDLQAHGQPFLSTNEVSFAEGAVGEYIRGLFPDPGPYEEAP